MAGIPVRPMLFLQMEQIQARNSHLQQHVAHMKQQKDMLCGQLEDMESKYEKVTIENKQLAIEIQALRQSLQVAPLEKHET